MPEAGIKLTTETVAEIRKNFPILNALVRGKRTLVYLDNAATTQKPTSVIQSISGYYETENANAHRGVHWLSERATHAYECARKKVAGFIHANDHRQIIFTRGTTEAINLVANGFAKAILKKDDEVLISALEHHSNIVPWQLACEATGAHLKVIPLLPNGSLDMKKFPDLLNSKTRIVAVTQISNALGTITPIKEIIRYAHTQGIPVLVDGAQGIAHSAVNIQDLDCDFYAFSGHKMIAPTGIGVLYGKRSWLEKLPPYQGGGDMIREVTFEKSTYNDIPFKFEAGTPHIAGAIGLAAAIDFLNSIGMENIARYEAHLLSLALEKLSKEPGITLFGPGQPMQAGLVSFAIDGVHPHDIGTILDREGIAVRAGHHCAQPVMDFLKVPATVRASFSFYNTEEEIDALVDGIRKVKKIFCS